MSSKAGDLPEMEAYSQEEQAERVQGLLDDADEQGYITIDEILDTFPKADDDWLEEELFDYFRDQGIDVYEDEEEALDSVLEELQDDREAPDMEGIAADNPISLYLTEVGSVPLLTRDEEQVLAKQVEQGIAAQETLDSGEYDPSEKHHLQQLVQQGQRAREHFIRANTRLVVSIAKNYRGRGLPFLDLIQAGNLGLIKAVDKFDYRRGTKFSTYATWWIRQSVTRTLAEKSRTIRLPVHMSDRIRKLYAMARKLEQKLGRWPTDEEIAEEMEMEPYKVQRLLRVSRRPLSLEKPVGDEEDGELGDFIEDTTSPSPSFSAEQQMLRENVRELLGTLAPREKRVLSMRFGMDDGYMHTLKEVGEKLGVSRERVRQIEARALRKLRRPGKGRKLRHFLR